MDDELFKGELEADESSFGGKRKGKRGRGAGHKTLVFGILERRGKVTVSIVPNALAESLMNETVKESGEARLCMRINGGDMIL